MLNDQVDRIDSRTIKRDQFHDARLIARRRLLRLAQARRRLLRLA
jgi:hypothetical protein